MGLGKGWGWEIESRWRELPSFTENSQSDVIQRPLSRHISHTTQSLVIGVLRGRMRAKLMTAKVASALLEETTIHLIWKVRLENVLGEKTVKSNSKPNRSFSRKMALIQAV